MAIGQDEVKTAYNCILFWLSVVVLHFLVSMSMALFFHKWCIYRERETVHTYIYLKF